MTMQILFLDVYKKSNSRISKDTAGGYGTENSIGDSLIGKLLSFIIKKSIFWPSLSFVQLFQEVKRENKLSFYHKISSNDPIPEGKWDFIFLCSSIVCFETEVKIAKKIMESFKTHIFFCGDVASNLKSMIPYKTTIIYGNYEFLIQELSKRKINLNELSKIRALRVASGDPEKLSVIKWEENGLPKTKHWFYSGRKNFYPFIFTRGCPYSCFEYCTYPLSQGRKTFQEDIASVIKKLSEIDIECPKSHIVFRDPVFSINIKNAKLLLKAIIEKNFSLSFSAELHLKNIDEEFINLCVGANVTLLKFGIESALEDIRKSVRRYSINNDEQRKTIETIRKAGIKTHGMFILAQPDDDLKSCDKTIDYACKLNLDIAQFSIFTPYPGTPYYIRNISNLDFNEYQDFSQFHMVYKHCTISKVEARRLLEKAYTKFILARTKRLISESIKNIFFFRI